MLLQAACAARLGRQMYNNLFIVVALYIENSGMVTRYFIFQRDDADPTVRSLESKQSCIFFTGSSRFSMTRTSNTGSNRPSCLSLCSKFTTWYRSYKVIDLCLEAFRNAKSGYSVPTFIKISRAHLCRNGRMVCGVASTSTTIARLSMRSLGQGTRWSRTMKTRMAGRR
jgi:hypothetical protein